MLLWCRPNDRFGESLVRSVYRLIGFAAVLGVLIGIFMKDLVIWLTR